MRDFQVAHSRELYMALAGIPWHRDNGKKLSAHLGAWKRPYRVHQPWSCSSQANMHRETLQSSRRRNMPGLQMPL